MILIKLLKFYQKYESFHAQKNNTDFHSKSVKICAENILSVADVPTNPHGRKLGLQFAYACVDWWDTSHG